MQQQFDAVKLPALLQNNPLFEQGPTKEAINRAVNVTTKLTALLVLNQLSPDVYQYVYREIPLRFVFDCRRKVSATIS